jgi:hypothetical protein
MLIVQIWGLGGQFTKRISTMAALVEAGSFPTLKVGMPMGLSISAVRGTMFSAEP